MKGKSQINLEYVPDGATQLCILELTSQSVEKDDRMSPPLPDAQPTIRQSYSPSLTVASTTTVAFLLGFADP